MRASQRGAAALELALAAPVLLLLLLGSIDVSNAILVTRRLEAVATAVADMASTGSAQEQALNIITD